MLYGETTLWVFASAPCIFSRKNLILSSQKWVAAEPVVLLSGSRGGAALVFAVIRSRRGFARVRKGYLSSAPQRCHPCRSSCMSQIIQKRKGNHKTSRIFDLRAVFRDPYRTFSPSEAALFSFFFFKK